MNYIKFDFSGVDGGHAKALEFWEWLNFVGAPTKFQEISGHKGGETDVMGGHLVMHFCHLTTDQVTPWLVADASASQSPSSGKPPSC